MSKVTRSRQMIGLTYPSKEQKLKLVELVNGDPQLKNGKFDQTFTKKDAQRRWEAISTFLNKIQGPQRNWKGWKKVSLTKNNSIFLHTKLQKFYLKNLNAVF